MKIGYYCQHVLGVGHFHRSLEVCKALSDQHEVTMIVGGPAIELEEPDIRLFQLPGLKMDEQFSGLIPCSQLPLETVKRRRCDLLLEFIATYRPDCVIIELYPLGRKNFRFELDPLLSLLSETGCPVFCSLRDILVEKVEGQKKFEERAVETLNTYFTGLLVHADASLVRLEETFHRTDDIRAGIHYTGFISPRPSPGARSTIRSRLNIEQSTPLIVASIGSGSVGFELLTAVIEAVQQLKTNGHSIMLQLFAGPYLDDDRYDQLLTFCSSSIRVQRFSKSFVNWLAAADVSISMAGYNTSMNVLAAGTPSLMYPFNQNQEQRMRIERLCETHDITLVEQADLVPAKLSELIRMKCKRARFVCRVNLDGARKTAEIIQGYFSA